jgi:hypothetical protein
MGIVMKKNRVIRVSPPFEKLELKGHELRGPFMAFHKHIHVWFAEFLLVLLTMLLSKSGL